MNTFTGSLQRKGRRYYLVLTTKRQQRWVALKTDSLRIARCRAAQISPHEANDEASWLVQLVRLGEEASRRLAREHAHINIPWRRLWDAFCSRTPTPIPAASAPVYRRWLDMVADAAPTHRAPCALTAKDARSIANAIAAHYVSASRIAVFLRRVWRTLGWDADIWPSGRSLAQAADGRPEHEFYRRLETDEVRRIIRHLGAMSGNAKAEAFADMVLMGFCTGLRLSDVAELERSEVVSGGRFLSLQPNKTRHSKRRLLRIPLVGEARDCIRRRVAAAEADDDEFLFPPEARRRPTAAISRTFRACGVTKTGCGRASFHSLRATFISLMDEAGIPPHVTDAITGHAGGGMHARYTQPSDSALTNAVARAIPALTT